MKRTLWLALALILGLASSAQALKHKTYTCSAGDSKSLWDSLSMKSCSNYIATIDTTGLNGDSTCCQLCGWDAGPRLLCTLLPFALGSCPLAKENQPLYGAPQMDAETPLAALSSCGAATGAPRPATSTGRAPKRRKTPRRAA